MVKVVVLLFSLSFLLLLFVTLMLMFAVFMLAWLSREGESVWSVGNDGGSGGSCAASGDGMSCEFVVVVGLLGVLSDS